jgi:hypothetical protein
MKFAPSLIAICFLAACGARSSDEQKVRELVVNMENAAEKRDASDVLEFIADDYEDANGFDKDQLKNFLRGYFLAHPKIQLMVSVEALEFPAEGVAHAEVTVTNVDLNDPDHAAFKVEFRHKDDGWRVTRADRLTPP